MTDWSTAGVRIVAGMELDTATGQTPELLRAAAISAASAGAQKSSAGTSSLVAHVYVWSERLELSAAAGPDDLSSGDELLVCVPEYCHRR